MFLQEHIVMAKTDVQDCHDRQTIDDKGEAGNGGWATAAPKAGAKAAANKM